MRILLALHQYFPEHIGGTELYTHGIARRLTRDGFDVAVVTYVESQSPKSEDHIISRSAYEGIEVYRIHYNLGVARNIAEAEYNNPQTEVMFRQVVEEFRPTLVHFTHFMKISCSAAVVCQQLNIPYIVTLTDFWTICLRHTLLKWDGKTCNGPKHDTYCLKCFQQTHGVFRPSILNVHDLLLRHSLKLGRSGNPVFSEKTYTSAKSLTFRNSFIKEQILKARLCMTLSRFQKEMLVRNGYPADRIVVSQHGLETEGYEWSTEERSDKTINLVYIGSIVKHKGVHLVLEALQQSGNRDIKLKIYGDISGNDPYKAMIQELAGKDNRVTLAGTVPFKLLGKVYKEADVLLMPSLWYENEPLVVKAALYQGIPVIANKIGSLKEMVEHGKSGWLLPTGDLISWITILDKLDRKMLHDIQPDRMEVRLMEDNYKEIFSYYKTHSL